MPLIIGMVACLLLLGAGVTAATSAFLARGRLQHSCDGAASAATDATQRTMMLSGIAGSVGGSSGGANGGANSGMGEIARAAARDYLVARSPSTTVDAAATSDVVELSCTAESDITFGSLFGVSTMTLTVHAAGHPTLSP